MNQSQRSVYQMLYELEIRTIPILIEYGHGFEEAEMIAAKILNIYRKTIKLIA